MEITCFRFSELKTGHMHTVVSHLCSHKLRVDGAEFGAVLFECFRFVELIDVSRCYDDGGAKSIFAAEGGGSWTVRGQQTCDWLAASLLSTTA